MTQVHSRQQIIKSKRELFQVRIFFGNKKKKKRPEIIIVLTGAKLLARESEIFVNRILRGGFLMRCSRAIESCCHAFILNELRFFLPRHIDIIMYISFILCQKHITARSSCYYCVCLRLLYYCTIILTVHKYHFFCDCKLCPFSSTLDKTCRV